MSSCIPVGCQHCISLSIARWPSFIGTNFVTLYLLIFSTHKLCNPEIGHLSENFQNL